MLRARDLRPTSQRLVILQYLSRENAHLKPEDVVQSVNQEFPAASRATVYNTLHSLVEAGLVNEVPAEDGGRYYELNRGPHHHFVCEYCGSIEDVSLEQMKAPEFPDLPGFRVESVEVTLRGACSRPECLSRSQDRQP
jgi:Fur family transcriptional regulator, peroxide stress response regulator